MIGAVKAGKDHYLLRKETKEEVESTAKTRRHKLLSVLPDEREEMLQRMIERQAALHGGSVIEDVQ